MANSAGIVTKVSGVSYAISGENTTPLAVGSSFSASDILVTKADASLEVKFHDDSLVSLGPSSRIEVKEFIFDAEQQVEPSFVVHMFEGVVRSVSGKVVEQNPEAFKLSSPLATIGIRGTETLHIISPANEMHAVVSLGAGHTVVMGTPDGRSIVISDSLQGLKLALNDFSPLQIINTNPEVLDEYINKIQSEGSVGAVQTNPQGVFVFADAEFLNSIASVNLITGSVGFLAIEQLGNLVTVLDVENSIAADLVSEVFTEDILPVSYLEPRSTSITAEQVASDPTTPDPITPNPIVPDPIVPPPPPSGPSLSGQSVSPSNVQDLTGINTDGNDTLAYGNVVNSTIAGDAYRDIGNSAVPGSDNILIDSITTSTIAGDAGRDMGGSTLVHGGNDTITIGTMNSGVVSGDAGNEITNSASGGNDNIIITTMNNGIVSGDAGGQMDGGSTAGNDIITITTMNNGTVSGDAAGVMLGSASGGNDIINITTMTGGTVSGDAGGAMSGGATTGDDTITIGTMSGGIVYGDAYGIATGIAAGNDVITINSMTGGTVYGDAETSQLGINIAGGNDTITIASMSGGTVVGGVGTDSINIASMSNGHVSGGTGNDTINIGSISGGNIFGGDGNDTIIVDRVHAGSINLYGGYQIAAAGDGNDTFVFKGAGANSTITIKDFGQTSGTNFDYLDFTQGMSLTGQTVVGSDLHLTATSGGNTLTVVLENITSLQAGQIIP